MLEPILSVVFVIILVFSIISVIKQRKKAGVTGFKSVLTPICFFLISINCLLAIWFKYMGLAVWLINGVLLLLAAYFTKYLQKTKN